MMSAFFSAVSGMKSQTTGLNNIANNIANVNTTGYKSQRTTFSDLLSQTIRSASGATANSGGTNPSQIGSGVGVSGTSTNMTPGSTQYTGIATDLAISGDGFFVVANGDGTYSYTREGDIGWDLAGNLMIGGKQVCGWMKKDANGNIITNGEPEPLNFYSDDYVGNKKTMAANQTSEAAYSGVLNSSKTAHGTALDNIGTVPTTPDATTSVTYYDTQGNAYNVTRNWYKCYTNNTDSNNPVTSWYYEDTCSNGTISPSSGYVQFDKSGNLTSPTTPTTQTVTPGSGVGTAPFTVKGDLSKITTGNSTSGVSATQDGYTTGTLQSFGFNANGEIIGTYNNNKTQILGQVALGTFTNPAGLEKTGNNLYKASANSGTVSYYAAGDGGTSALGTSCLEMSNVDLAQEFSNMMITQRAYQASSKVISTSDDMLQSLINMK
ncbi:hypothetical protein P22_1424 [Propionispora sp. 2/2-37]|uniref:flagellar hook protein FlgE n=1 Tax=Propionispora sp. 2/2-37 TaxID=1677858 RepID=UPI0006BB652C|nr:flagellar hook-basal body complex protein [Propionispora sp. 2/2-37]CUH95354.1 hypothetical protein P22_1424 [Propionispora sp. 2/2-37]